MSLAGTVRRGAAQTWARAAAASWSGAWAGPDARALAAAPSLRSASSLAAPVEEPPPPPSAAPPPPALARGGQPLPGLPHRNPALRPGDLTPGVPASEYGRRRAALLARLPAGSLAVLAAPPRAAMSGAIPYPYRPDSNLFYLTGLTAPGVVALIGGRAGSFTLFVPDPDPSAAVWDGASLTVEEAVACAGADGAAPLSALGPALAAAVRGGGGAPVFTDDPAAWGGRPAPGSPPSLSHATGVASLPSSLISGAPAAAAALAAAGAAGRVRPLSPALAPLRWLKSKHEAAALAASAALAAAGLRAAAAATAAGVPEWTLAAEFEYVTRAGGAARPAYPPVVAAGADGCTIHYSRADKACADGELVLMDAGCELHGYASDISRTWPVRGVFSGPGADVYDAVADVHARAVAAAVPGATLRSLHAATAVALADAALQLGALAPGPSPEAVVAARAHSGFFPHALSHFLGLDTHDTPGVGVDAPLEAGVVLTVEPGLYFSPGPPGSAPGSGWVGPDCGGRGIKPGPASAALAGLAVRIEDDVLVSAAGAPPAVLSSGFPTDRAGVEACVGARGAAAADAAAAAVGARVRRQ